MFAIMNGYDIRYTIRHRLSKLICKKVPPTLYTDGKSLYGCCISLSHTTGPCLLIALAVIRELCERRGITEIIWMQGRQNPAEDLTKPI